MSRVKAWPPSRVAKVRQMYAIGLSDRVIAERLGCSRGAVTSIRHRNGIRRKTVPKRHLKVVVLESFHDRLKVMAEKRGTKVAPLAALCMELGLDELGGG